MAKVILRSLVFLNPTQVQLIRGDPRYKLMSHEEVIGKFVSFELMIKGSKKIIEQGATSTPEVQPIAFKATEEKKEESTSSRLPINASKLDNEEMALIIKSFRQILKQRRGKDYKSRSKKVCYKCGKPSHFIAKCPLSSDSDRNNDKRGKKKEKKRYYKTFDASYVLTNKSGKVVAKYVGDKHKGSKTCVWVPKVLVSNVKGPKTVWVPKNKA
jgi:hypothetical protein